MVSPELMRRRIPRVIRLSIRPIISPSPSSQPMLRVVMAIHIQAARSTPRWVHLDIQAPMHLIIMLVIRRRRSMAAIRRAQCPARQPRWEGMQQRPWPTHLGQLHRAPVRKPVLDRGPARKPACNSCSRSLPRVAMDSIA